MIVGLPGQLYGLVVEELPGGVVPGSARRPRRRGHAFYLFYCWHFVFYLLLLVLSLFGMYSTVLILFLFRPLGRSCHSRYLTGLGSSWWWGEFVVRRGASGTAIGPRY